MIGPVHSADAPSYSNFADVMIASSRWLHDADLTSEVFPIMTFRIIGYPAVIAAAKLLAGAAWPYAVVGLQFAVSTGVFIAVFCLGMALGLPRNWTVAGALAYAASLQLSLDQCLMSDSLNACMIILAVVRVCWSACLWSPSIKVMNSGIGTASASGSSRRPPRSTRFCPSSMSPRASPRCSEATRYSTGTLRRFSNSISMRKRLRSTTRCSGTATWQPRFRIWRWTNMRLPGGSIPLPCSI